MDDYGTCPKCGKWGYVKRHQCPPLWLCWEAEMAVVDSKFVDNDWVDSPDLPSSDTDGLIANGARRVYATAPDAAAEEYARICDNRAADWSTEVRTVCVRLADEPAAEPSEYRVDLEMVAEYNAILHVPVKKATP